MTPKFGTQTPGKFLGIERGTAEEAASAASGLWFLSVGGCLFSGLGIADGVAGHSSYFLLAGGILCVSVLTRVLAWKVDCTERLTLGRFTRLAWGCACWTAAVFVPQVICQPWISRSGALTAGEYTLASGVAAGTFAGGHLLGWAVRNPWVAMKYGAWLALAGLAAWGVKELFEALTVKALLFIIAGLLVLKLWRRD